MDRTRTNPKPWKKKVKSLPCVCKIFAESNPKLSQRCSHCNVLAIASHTFAPIFQIFTSAFWRYVTVVISLHWSVSLPPSSLNACCAYGSGVKYRQFIYTYVILLVWVSLLHSLFWFYGEAPLDCFVSFSLSLLVTHETFMLLFSTKFRNALCEVRCIIVVQMHLDEKLL